MNRLFLLADFKFIFQGCILDAAAEVGEDKRYLRGFDRDERLGCGWSCAGGLGGGGCDRRFLRRGRGLGLLEKGFLFLFFFKRDASLLLAIKIQVSNQNAA